MTKLHAYRRIDSDTLTWHSDTDIFGLTIFRTDKLLLPIFQTDNVSPDNIAHDNFSPDNFSSFGFDKIKILVFAVCQMTNLRWGEVDGGLHEGQAKTVGGRWGHTRRSI